MSKNNPKGRPDDYLHSARVDGCQIRIQEPHLHPLLLKFWQDFRCEDRLCDDAEVWLSANPGGIECHWRHAQKSLLLQIDVDKFVSQQKSYPARRGGVLNQALGKRTQRIADLTGGWGGDALLLSSQGYRVSIFERHPLMALLLNDAMQRLATTQWVTAQNVSVPDVTHADAATWLRSARSDEVDRFECFYLDPMFPPKRKRSAAPNKHMQFLQWLLGTQADAGCLLEQALASGVKRVVVKRPAHAEPLLPSPAERFSGKLVHYDVYLNHG